MSYEFTLWVRPGTSVVEDWANAVYEAVVMTRWSAVTAVRITSASIATRPPSMKQSAPLSALSIKLEAK